MPEPSSINNWTLSQTLAWIACRDAGRVDTAYREWRDGHYAPYEPSDWLSGEAYKKRNDEPQSGRLSKEAYEKWRDRRYAPYEPQSDWRSKEALIRDWRSPVAELDEAAQALRRMCKAGDLHCTGREGADGPRCEIASLRWLDLVLTDIAEITVGPQLYDSSADLLAITDRRVGPAFYAVLFVVADVVKAFPGSKESATEPELEKESATEPASANLAPSGAETEADLPPLWRDVKAGLLRMYPVRKPVEATYEILVEGLKGNGVGASRATVAKVIKIMPLSWRGKRRGKRRGKARVTKT